MIHLARHPHEEAGREKKKNLVIFALFSSCLIIFPPFHHRSKATAEDRKCLHSVSMAELNMLMLHKLSSGWKSLKGMVGRVCPWQHAAPAALGSVGWSLGSKPHLCSSNKTLLFEKKVGSDNYNYSIIDQLDSLNKESQGCKYYRNSGEWFQIRCNVLFPLIYHCPAGASRECWYILCLKVKKKKKTWLICFIYWSESHDKFSTFTFTAFGISALTSLILVQ